MKLTNCVVMNKEYPGTFKIPSEYRIKNIKIGDYVKLMFDERERMWVKVTERNDNSFKGTLENDPLLIKCLKFEDLIEFKTCHIVEIL